MILRRGFQVAWMVLLISSGRGLAAAPVRNVILFVGDGMGLGLITASRVYAVGAKGRLEMEALPHTALVRTCSQDGVVTDSAASISALATGFKHPNRALNLRENGERPPLISELAHRAGKSAGVVTTARLTDATPAGFYGRVDLRDKEELLATQLVDSGLDLALGGGLQFFLPKSRPPGVREDGVDWLALARDKGWRLITSPKELEAMREEKGAERWLGIFAPYDFHYADERGQNPDEPSLSHMTRAAIHALSRNPKGYFLMVEGGMIDKANHQNRAWRALQEMMEFDRAIGVALREAGKETLILVTADHETGGLALNGYPPIEIRGNDLLARQTDQGFLLTWTTGPGAMPSPSPVPFLSPLFQQPAARYMGSAAHVATDVMLAATGPGSEEVHGFLENTDIFQIMRRALGVKSGAEGGD